MGTQHGWTRRELLELGIAAGLVPPAAGRLAAGAATSRPSRNRAAPRNVIFLVSDGMSLGVPSLAEPFSQMVRGRGTRWYELLRDPRAVHGVCATESLNSPVTDSAAASSAWGSGVRVFNGALNVLPDGRRLTPIAALLRQTGRRVGLVTTTTITHATPAGFAAVEENRENQAAIAPQYLDVVDVLLGGGRQFFLADLREDGRDVAGEYAAKGYAVWTRRREVISGARPQRVLGVFADGHLPYTIDHAASAELRADVPTLVEMTRAALEILSDSGTGFFLMVEGGRVDHAAHNNDAAALLHDQLAFDDALAVAVDWAAEREDTLVLVTSDHGNGNFGLNGVGSSYEDSQRYFERVQRARGSFEELSARLSGAPTTRPARDEIRQVVESVTGIRPGSKEADAIRAALEGQPPVVSHQRANLVGVLGEVIGNYTGTGWIGTTHTSDLVLRSAWGPGAECFVGLMHHVDVFAQLAQLFDLPHRNPSMSVEEARPYRERAAVSLHPHWLNRAAPQRGHAGAEASTLRA